MGIVAAGIPLVVAGGGGPGLLAAVLLGSTALSVGMGLLARGNQPKVNTNQAGVVGAKSTTTNDGAAPRSVVIGRDRVAGSLVHWEGHEEANRAATITTAISDWPIDGFEAEIVDDKKLVLGVDLVKNNTLSNPYDDADDDDWVPVPGGSDALKGVHGDYWHVASAATGPYPQQNDGPLYYKNNNYWQGWGTRTVWAVDESGARPSAALGADGNYAYDTSSSKVWKKQYGRVNPSDDPTLIWVEIANSAPATGPFWYKEKTDAPENPTSEGFTRYNDEKGQYDWYLKFRFHDGTQTTSDPYLETRYDDWDSTCVGFGTAYKAATFRYHPQVYPGTYPPKNASIVRGVKSADPRISAGGASVDWFGTSVTEDQVVWTENAALCAMFARCWPGLPGAVEYAAIDENTMTTAAIRSDTTVTNADASTEPRYTVNGSISSDERWMEIKEGLALALGGDIYNVGSVVKIIAGAALTAGEETGAPVFDENDILLPYDTRPEKPATERINRVIGNWHKPELNYNQVSIKPVAPDANAETEDGGKRFEESTYFRYAGHSKFTARRQGKILARKHRLMEDVNITFGHRGLMLLPGAVIKLTDSVMGWNETLFEVRTVESEILTANSEGVSTEPIRVTCSLREYQQGTWNDPNEPVEDEDSNNLKTYDPRVIEPPENLTLIIDERTDHVARDGRMFVDVVARIDRVDNPWTAGYEMQYKLNDNTFYPGSPYGEDSAEYAEEMEWKALEWSPKRSAAKPKRRLKGLRRNAYYDVRARTKNNYGNYSDDMEDVVWANEVIYYVSGEFRLLKPPTAAEGENQISNGRFESGNDGWDLTGVESDGDEAIRIRAEILGDGFYSPPVMNVELAAGKRMRFRTETFIPTRSGDLWNIGVWVKLRSGLVGTGPGDFAECKLRALFVDENNSTIGINENLLLSTLAWYTDPALVVGDWLPLSGSVQTPSNDLIRGISVQIDPDGTDSSQPSNWSFDGVFLDTGNIFYGAQDSDLKTIVGDTWQTLVGQAGVPFVGTGKRFDLRAKFVLEDIASGGTTENKAYVRLIRTLAADPNNQANWKVLYPDEGTFPNGERVATGFDPIQENGTAPFIKNLNDKFKEIAVEVKPPDDQEYIFRCQLKNAGSGTHAYTVARERSLLLVRS